MKCNYLNKAGNNSVIVFFNGWGMDYHTVSHLSVDGFDVIECNSYHDEGSFWFEEIERYEKKYLIAYSMGIWAASLVFKSFPGLFDFSFAIAGSPFPVDDLKGIPAIMITATLQNFSPVSFEKFNLRMCGSADVLKFYNTLRPVRSIEDCRNELQYILDNSKNVNNEFCFDIAIIAKNDRIFPMNNLQHAYSNTKQIILDAPHFPFYLWNSWNDLIKFYV